MSNKIIYILTALIFPVAAWPQNRPVGGNAPQFSLPPVPAAYTTAVPINYVRTWEPRKTVTDTSAVSLNDNARFKTASAYFDGLGRSLQTVIKGNNYDGTKDIVSMEAYDEFGREQKEYLSYAPATGNNGKFRLNPFAEQQAYYNTHYQDQHPFAKNEYEASPGGSAYKIYGAGNSWAGSNRGVTKDFSFNTGSDDVRTVSIGYTTGAVPVFGEVFPPGELLKNITTDEHGKQTIEYKDREERLILKKTQLSDAPAASYNGWLCTYYVYDDLGRLRYVIPPKAVDWLQTHGWQFSGPEAATVKDELCFIYEYDSEERVSAKKMPGAGIVYLCYDKRDRLTYSQDGHLRSQGKWLVTFYDDMNRPVSTAIYSTTQTQQQLQTALDALTAANPVPSIPEASLLRLNNTFYDEYTMPGAAAFNQNMVNTAQSNTSGGDEVMEPLLKSSLMRGLPTGTQTRVLGTTQMLSTTVYYDTKGRPLQSHNTNTKGGTDVTTLVYSFTGKILSSYVQHNNPAAALPNTQTTNVYTRNTFNNDYLLKTEKKINGEAWKRVLQMEYDDMGKAVKKQMGDAAGNFFITLDYNLRGWLTGINKTAHQNLENGAMGSTAFYEAIFSEMIHYDHGYSKQNYNGNISGIRWANASDKQSRSYGFDYDNANRLLQADFTQKNNTEWNTGAGIDYSLMWMRYDANGNILNLAQKALKLNSSPEIDRLAYGYLPLSNKLVRVTDTLNDPATKLGDFKDGSNNDDDYAFDANGSMVQDKNKNIGNITYNHLSLPQTIAVTGKGTVEYTYDATGNKLQKKVSEPGRVTITDYISGFVYQKSYPVVQGPAMLPGDTLLFMGHEEGRVRYAKKYYANGDSAYQWQYDYFYKDHLGNIRAVVTEQKDTMKYMATFETDYRSRETALFHKISETAVPVSGIADYPGTQQYTSSLNGLNKKTGASVTLKVMAGDKIDLGVQYWYPRYFEAGETKGVQQEDIIGSLTTFLGGDAAALNGGKATPGELAQSNILPAAIQSFLNTQTSEPATEGRPNAYLNWILLDEQFRWVPSGSGYLRVDHYSAGMQTLATTGLPVPKSGYLFVYLSNETVHHNVFFDNLVVQHRTGPLLETTDYTPWGLEMKMIGSKAFGRLENKKKYNGIEQTNEFDLNQYDAFYRNLDCQIGRWWQVDPKAAQMYEWSPYNLNFDNPVKFSDFLGDNPLVGFILRELAKRAAIPAAKWIWRNRFRILQTADVLQQVLTIYENKKLILEKYREEIVNETKNYFYREIYNSEVKPKIILDWYTEPKNEAEARAMAEAKLNGGEGMKKTFKKKDGHTYRKFYYNKTENGSFIEIHYELDLNTGEKKNYKFIDVQKRALNNKLIADYQNNIEKKVRQYYNAYLNKINNEIKVFRNRIR